MCNVHVQHPKRTTATNNVSRYLPIVLQACFKTSKERIYGHQARAFRQLEEGGIPVLLVDRSDIVMDLLHWQNERISSRREMGTQSESVCFRTAGLVM